MENDLPGTGMMLWSHDAVLAATRSLLFQRAGFRVESVSTAEQFERTFENVSPELILFCQTLDEAECLRGESFAKARSPDVRTIVMVKNRVRYVPEGTGILVRCDAGPVFLLESAHKLVSHAQTT